MWVPFYDIDHTAITFIDPLQSAIMLIPNEEIPIIRSWSNRVIVRTKEVHCLSDSLVKNALFWTYWITIFYSSHISSTCVAPSRSNNRYVRPMDTRCIIRRAWWRFEDSKLIHIDITGAGYWPFLSCNICQTLPNPAQNWTYSRWHHRWKWRGILFDIRFIMCRKHVNSVAAVSCILIHDSTGVRYHQKMKRTDKERPKWRSLSCRMGIQLKSTVHASCPLDLDMRAPVMWSRRREVCSVATKRPNFRTQVVASCPARGIAPHCDSIIRRKCRRSYRKP